MHPTFYKVGFSVAIENARNQEFNNGKRDKVNRLIYRTVPCFTNTMQHELEASWLLALTIYYCKSIIFQYIMCCWLRIVSLSKLVSIFYGKFKGKKVSYDMKGCVA